MSAIDELVRELPHDVLVTDPDVMTGYRRDRADLVGAGTPAAVARPVSTEQVSELLRWASRHGVTVVPRGAGTGLSGGANAIDGCLMVCLERMTAIREIDAVDQVAVAEAGVINADLERAARQHGMFYAPDPGSFEISTIGGNVATNAGGMRCVKYGVTRDSVLRLEVVLADGRLLRTGARSIKNVAGLDLTSLFIGSEGTLGIITAATVKLRPLPATPPAVFVASFPTMPAAGRAVSMITAAAVTPSMLELMDNATINAIEDYQRMDLDRGAAALLIGQADGPDALLEAERITELCQRAGADYVACTQDPQEADGLIANIHIIAEALQPMHVALPPEPSPLPLGVVAMALLGCGQGLFALRLLGDGGLSLGLCQLKLLTHGFDAGFKGFLPATALPLDALGLLLAVEGSGCLARLLRKAAGSGEYSFGADINIEQIDALSGEQKFAELVGVRHAARFQDVQGAVALGVELDISHEKPGVDDGRDSDFSAFGRFAS